MIQILRCSYISILLINFPFLVKVDEKLIPFFSDTTFDFGY